MCASETWQCFFFLFFFSPLLVYLIFLFGNRSCCVDQPDLELAILLPQSPALLLGLQVCATTFEITSLFIITQLQLDLGLSEREPGWWFSCTLTAGEASTGRHFWARNPWDSSSFATFGKEWSQRKERKPKPNQPNKAKEPARCSHSMVHCISMLPRLTVGTQEFWILKSTSSALPFSSSVL